VDELMTVAHAAGMDLRLYPNLTQSESPDAKKLYFECFYRDYVRYCMDWPEESATRLSEAMRPYMGYFATVDPPYCFSTFVFRKR
jgi:hypothetical protein